MFGRKGKGKRGKGGKGKEGEGGRVREGERRKGKEGESGDSNLLKVFFCVSEAQVLSQNREL